MKEFKKIFKDLSDDEKIRLVSNIDACLFNGYKVSFARQTEGIYSEDVLLVKLSYRGRHAQAYVADGWVDDLKYCFIELMTKIMEEDFNESNISN